MVLARPLEVVRAGTELPSVGRLPSDYRRTSLATTKASSSTNNAAIAVGAGIAASSVALVAFGIDSCQAFPSMPVGGLDVRSCGRAAAIVAMPTAYRRDAAVSRREVASRSAETALGALGRIRRRRVGAVVHRDASRGELRRDRARPRHSSDDAAARPCQAPSRPAAQVRAPPKARVSRT